MNTILIIGGSTGIGEQLAKQLSQSGNRVFATYSKNERTSNETSLSYHYCNVLDDILDFSYLPDVIDGLVYCPGSIYLRPFSRIQANDYIKDYELQVVGAIKTLQAVLPKLKLSKNASVVLFSTVAVQTGMSFHSLVAASKGAIEGLTKALAAELAPTIRVNAIAPSLTDTPLAGALLNTPEKRDASAQRHPLKRIGTVEDIANMAEYLLSEKASWISGQILHVDGGLSAIK